MVIVTAIPADPCQFPTADLINKLSVANKQDYARLHGFELHVSSDIIDPNITAVRAGCLRGMYRCSYGLQIDGACRNRYRSACSRMQTRVTRGRDPARMMIMRSMMSHRGSMSRRATGTRRS